MQGDQYNTLDSSRLPTCVEEIQNYGERGGEEEVEGDVKDKVTEP